MTNANMKLVVVDVPFPHKLEVYDQKLDAGEFITRRVVELSKLSEEFKGELKFRSFDVITLNEVWEITEYERKVSLFDTKRYTWAHLVYPGFHNRCEARSLCSRV